MPKGPYRLLYPDRHTEGIFNRFLSNIPKKSRCSIVDALESLEIDPTPRSTDKLQYRENNPQTVKLFLRFLPGILFNKSDPNVLRDYLIAKHRIVVEGIIVSYSIDDSRKLVWLMEIRSEALPSNAA